MSSISSSTPMKFCMRGDMAIWCESICRGWNTCQLHSSTYAVQTLCSIGVNFRLCWGRMIYSLCCSDRIQAQPVWIGKNFPSLFVCLSKYTVVFTCGFQFPALNRQSLVHASAAICPTRVVAVWGWITLANSPNIN